MLSVVANFVFISLIMVMMGTLWLVFGVLASPSMKGIFRWQFFDLSLLKYTSLCGTMAIL